MCSGRPHATIRSWWRPAGGGTARRACRQRPLAFLFVLRRRHQGSPDGRGWKWGGAPERRTRVLTGVCRTGRKKSRIFRISVLICMVYSAPTSCTASNPPSARGGARLRYGTARSRPPTERRTQPTQGNLAGGGVLLCPPWFGRFPASNYDSVTGFCVALCPGNLQLECSTVG
jgi:hypothetical protein